MLSLLKLSVLKKGLSHGRVNAKGLRSLRMVAYGVLVMVDMCAFGVIFGSLMWGYSLIIKLMGLIF